MTWLGWAALAAGLAVLGRPAEALARAALLTGGGRLAVDAHQRRAPGITIRSSRPAWSASGAAFGGAAAAVIAVIAVAVAGGALLSVAASAVLAASAWCGRDVLARRTATAHRRDLHAAVRMLVGELEAGSNPPAALAAAAEAGPRVGAALAAAAAAARRGDDAASVLTAAPDRDLQVVGAAWRLGDATGAALADVLSRVAADLAAVDEQRRTVAVALAGPRASATVLAGLPLLGIALGAAMGARPLPFLVEPGPGRALCCVGVLLDVAGVLWMRRILRGAERT